MQVLDARIQLCYWSLSAAMERVQMRAPSCVPIKLYLQTQPDRATVGQSRGSISAGARFSGVSPPPPESCQDQRASTVWFTPHLFSRQEQSPGGLRSCSFRSPVRKNQNTAPSKDYAFSTLTQLEMDLVKFVSKVRNLKVAMATGGHLKLQHLEAPADPHNNITIYEIWGEEDSE